MNAETVVALDNAGDGTTRWQNCITVAFGGFMSDIYILQRSVVENCRISIRVESVR